MSRRSGPRIERTGPGSRSPTSEEDPTEDPEEDLPEELQNEDTRGTSIGDITQEADAERFDRTFLAEKESFQLGGEVTSPAPFPLQVLPRMAYTINYNVVYDEDRERWVPQKKSNGGVDSFPCKATLASDISVGTGGSIIVPLDKVSYDRANGFDTGSNEYTVQTDGVYLSTGQVAFEEPGGSNSGIVAVSVQANGSNIANTNIFLDFGDGDRFRRITTVGASELNQGDTVEFKVENNTGGSLTLLGGVQSTNLTIQRVGK